MTRKILVFGQYNEMFKYRKCFKTRDSAVHENCYDRMIAIESRLKEKGFELVTTYEVSKKTNLEIFSALIVFDHPLILDGYSKFYKLNVPKILIAEEVEILNSNNYDINIYNNYDLIFTWDKDKVDNKKVIYYYSLFPDVDRYFRSLVNFTKTKDQRGKILVATNHQNLPNTLYPYRKELVEWYANNMPDDFSVYGRYWIRNIFYGNDFISRIKNSKFLDFFYKNKKSVVNNVYKGILTSKYNILHRFKFNFCIENFDNKKGYLTEKIWDSLISGVIPVYYPSDKQTLDSLIPQNCYINMKEFNSFTQLNEFLDGLTDSQRQSYLDNAYTFLNNISPNLKPGVQAEEISKKIVEVINKQKK